MTTARQLKILTQQLEASENRFLFALEAAELGIWEWNIKEDSLIWDNQMLTVFGLSKEEFIDNNNFFESLVHPDDLPSVKLSILKAIKDHGKFELTYRIHLKTGYCVPITSKGKVQLVDGEPVSLIGVAYRESECPRYNICPIRTQLMDELYPTKHS